jgi:hypothetical protein
VGQGYSREVDPVADGFGVSPSAEMLEHAAVLVNVEVTI